MAEAEDLAAAGAEGSVEEERRGDGRFLCLVPSPQRGEGGG